MIFDILWIFDLVLAAIVGYFFIAGIANRSISDFNAGIWFVILASVGGILLGAHLLHGAGYTALACVTLSILAAPGALYGVFLLAVIFSGTKWN